MIRIALAAAVLGGWTATAPAAAAVCVGDCNANGTVTVDELVKAVNVSLGKTTLSACPAADRDGDGRVGIDELVTAVDRSLNGCMPVAEPGTFAVLVNPADSGVAAYRTLEGDNVLYQGTKDANGLATAVRSASVSSADGQIQAVIDYDGNGRVIRIRTRDGATVDLDWSSAANVRFVVHGADGSNVDYSVPFAHATAAAATTSAGGTTYYEEAVVRVRRCNAPVTDATVTFTWTALDSLRYFGNAPISFRAQQSAPGTYRVAIPRIYEPSPLTPADICHAAQSTLAGLCKTADLAQQAPDYWCRPLLGIPDIGGALYLACVKAIENHKVPCQYNRVAENFCDYLPQDIDILDAPDFSLEPQVRVPNSATVFTGPTVTISTGSHVPDFGTMTLPNAVNGASVLVVGGPGADGTLGAGDAGGSVKCAPSNTPVVIRWHHAVQLGDQARTCTVSGDGNCDYHFGPVVDCCELCPGGCSAAICPGDFFATLWPGGSLYLDASTLFAVTGAGIYPGCFF